MVDPGFWSQASVVPIMCLFPGSWPLDQFNLCTLAFRSEIKGKGDEEVRTSENRGSAQATAPTVTLPGLPSADGPGVQMSI